MHFLVMFGYAEGEENMFVIGNIFSQRMCIILIRSKHCCRFEMYMEEE